MEVLRKTCLSLENKIFKDIPPDLVISKWQKDVNLKKILLFKGVN